MVIYSVILCVNVDFFLMITCRYMTYKNGGLKCRPHILVLVTFGWIAQMEDVNADC